MVNSKKQVGTEGMAKNCKWKDDSMRKRQLMRVMSVY